VQLAMVVAFLGATSAEVRDRAHRPLAALLLLEIVSDMALGWILARWVTPWSESVTASGGDPRVVVPTGDVLIAAHVYRAFWVAWTPALCAVVANAFGIRRPWPMLLLWTSMVAWLLFGDSWGYKAKPAYVRVEVIALAYAAAAFAVWFNDWRKRRTPWGQHQRAALACLAFHAVYLLVYYHNPWREWDLARIPLLVMFSVVAVLEWSVACTGKPSSAP
jgi:hypothetical protein